MRFKILDSEMRESEDRSVLENLSHDLYAYLHCVTLLLMVARNKSGFLSQLILIRT